MCNYQLNEALGNAIDEFLFQINSATELQDILTRIFIDGLDREHISKNLNKVADTLLETKLKISPKPEAPSQIETVSELPQIDDKPVDTVLRQIWSDLERAQKTARVRRVEFQNYYHTGKAIIDKLKAPTPVSLRGLLDDNLEAAKKYAHKLADDCETLDLQTAATMAHNIWWIAYLEAKVISLARVTGFSTKDLDDLLKITTFKDEVKETFHSKTIVILNNARDHLFPKDSKEVVTINGAEIKIEDLPIAEDYMTDKAEFPDPDPLPCDKPPMELFSEESADIDEEGEEKIFRTKSDPVLTSDEAKRRLQFLTYFSWFVAIAIVVVLGLEKYLNNPTFGTPGDYFTLIVYGLGGSTAREAALAVVKGLGLSFLGGG